MVLELAIICAVAGTILGLRCNVLVLVPTITFAMMLAGIVGIARADGAWSVILMTVALGSAVQLGYLAGTTTRALIGSSARIWGKAAVMNSAQR
jgi:hypothetical protein